MCCLQDYLVALLDRWRTYGQNNVAYSGLTDNETFSGSLNDRERHLHGVIDLHDAFDLGEEAVKQAEIAAGHPDDGAHNVGIEELSRERDSVRCPTSFQEILDLCRSQWPILVDKADP